MPSSILVIEDEPAISELISVNLQHAGHCPIRAYNAEQAQNLISDVLPDLILLDWMLPSKSGVTFARDLRNNERTKRLMEDGASRTVNIAEIKVSGEMAVSILRRALDAFARLDTVAAAQIVRDDKAIDEEFRAFVRKLVSYMMEDPRTISVGLDYLFIAKAIERIGDHAKNIAEFIIYIVKGTDVRHKSRDALEREALS